MKALILATLFLLPNLAHAADERARRDINGNPSLIAVDETSGEIKKVKTSSDGFLLTVSTGSGTAATVDQGAAGSEEWKVTTTSDTSTVEASQLGTWVLGANSGVDIGDTTNNNGAGAAAVNIQDGGNIITVDGTVVPDLSGNDTPDVSTASVAGSAVEVMVANVNRESSLVCNEGPEVARCGPSGEITAAIGQRLLVDQCYTKDGPKPYRGALSCISTTGGATKITVDESE